MNTKPLLIAFALALSAAVHAAEPASLDTSEAPLTRAAVRAEYERALASGELAQPTDSYGGYVYPRVRPAARSAATRLPREATAAEARAATAPRSGAL